MSEESRHTDRLDVDETQEDAHRRAYEETGHWGRHGAGCVIVARSSGRVLLPLRSDEVVQPDVWGTWGGAVDEGLTPEDQVRLEVLQEAGHEGGLELVPAFVFVDGSFSYANFVAIVEEEFEPVLNWESADARWFDPGDWPSPMHPGLDLLVSDTDSLVAILSVRTKPPTP